MSCARVQGTGVRSSSSVTAAAGQAVTFGSSTASSGSLIVVGCLAQAASGSTAPTVTVTDSKSNTYSTDATLANTSVFATRAAIYFVANAAGGASHSITVKPSLTAYVDISIVEVSGAALTSVLDGKNNGGGSSTSPSTGSVSVSAAGAFCFSFVAGSGGVTWATYTNGSGWSDNSHDGSSATVPYGAEYQIAGSAVTGQWTITSDTWAAIGASFAAATGGGGTDFMAILDADADTQEMEGGFGRSEGRGQRSYSFPRRMAPRFERSAGGLWLPSRRKVAA